MATRKAFSPPTRSISKYSHAIINWVCFGFDTVKLKWWIQILHPGITDININIKTQHQQEERKRTERTTMRIIMCVVSLLNLLQPALHQLRRPYSNVNGNGNSNSLSSFKFNMTKLLCLRHIHMQMDIDMDMESLQRIGYTGPRAWRISRPGTITHHHTQNHQNHTPY